MDVHGDSGPNTTVTYSPERRIHPLLYVRRFRLVDLDVRHWKYLRRQFHYGSRGRDLANWTVVVELQRYEIAIMGRDKF